MQRIIFALILAVLFVPVTNASTIYEFDLRLGAVYFDIRTERTEPTKYREEPIPQFSGSAIPEESYGTFLITDDAKIGTKDIYLSMPAVTGDLTRNQSVPGTFTNVDIVYHVETDPFIFEIPGEHYRQLYLLRNDNYYADTGVFQELIKIPSALTGSYKITGPTEELSGTFSIPITAINPEDWKGPLSDGNLNTVAKAFKNVPENWRPGNGAINYGSVYLYYDTDDWTDPCDFVVGTVDGVEVSLSYVGHRVSPYAMPTPTPEPATIWMLFPFGVMIFGRLRGCIS